MTMLGRDQLRNQTRLQNTFLLRFEEGVIEFPPSYKIGVENNVYNRERIPGWTDRIFSRKSKMKRVSYKCGTNIFGSDHRPIIAEFEK